MPLRSADFNTEEVHPHTTSTAIDGPTWYFRRHRQDRAERVNEFCREKFLLAVDSSWLNEGAKRTMTAMSNTANLEGLTATSGIALAENLQVRSATISAHWKEARIAGLLLTQRRFNSSSIQQLSWPGSGLRTPNATGTPTLSHRWSDAELEWWRTLDATDGLPSPWGSGVAPF